MNRRPSRSRPLQPSPQVTATEIQQGIVRLKKRLDEVSAFEPMSVIEQNNIPYVEALAAAVDEALIRTFGADTLDYFRYSDAAFFDNGPFTYAYRVPIEEVHASLARSKARSIALLTQAITALEERRGEVSASSPSQTISKPQVFDRKVFVVHGHDEGAREAIARFLERIGFEAIILHEQANQGRTVIEKVEVHGDVGFAVVLFTPDDEGAKKREPPAMGSPAREGWQAARHAVPSHPRILSARIYRRRGPRARTEGVALSELQPRGPARRQSPTPGERLCDDPTARHNVA